MTPKSFFILFLGFLILGCARKKEETKLISEHTPPVNKHKGMVWIEGGEFSLGSDDPTALKVEFPAIKTVVKGFWMDETEVTNAEFEEFIKATGYVTLAERPVN